MNYSTYRFTLDLQKHQSQQSIAVFRGDTAVQLLISLTDGGKPYTIKEGNYAVFYGKRADDEPLVHSCKLNETRSEIIYEFQDTTSFVEGIVNCQCRLYGTDQKLITAPRFTIVVDERVVNDDIEIEIPGSNLSALDDILINETARMNAETDRGNAEAIRFVNEGVREDNENIRKQNENERQAADGQRKQELANAVSTINTKCDNTLSSVNTRCDETLSSVNSMCESTLNSVNESCATINTKCDNAISSVNTKCDTTLEKVDAQYNEVDKKLADAWSMVAVPFDENGKLEFEVNKTYLLKDKLYGTLLGTHIAGWWGVFIRTNQYANGDVLGWHCALRR